MRVVLMFQTKEATEKKHTTYVQMCSDTVSPTFGWNFDTAAVIQYRERFNLLVVFKQPH